MRLKLVLYAENVEEFLLKKYGAEGYSKEQILKMKLKTVWPIIKDIKSKKGQFAFSPIHLNEGAIGYLECVRAGILSPLYYVFDIDETILNEIFL